MADTFELELVSPESLLLSEPDQLGLLVGVGRAVVRQAAVLLSGGWLYTLSRLSME